MVTELSSGAYWGKNFHRARRTSGAPLHFLYTSCDNYRELNKICDKIEKWENGKGRILLGQRGA